VSRSAFCVGIGFLVFAIIACVSDDPIDTAQGAPGGGVPADNVKANADFESGCSEWSGDRATLSATTVAHSGKGACLVCASEDEGVYTRTGRLDTTRLKTNTYYQARVWLRKPDDPTKIPSRELRVVLFIDNQPDANDVDGPKTDEAPTTPLTDSYVVSVSNKLQYVASPTARSFAMQIIERSSGPKACFLVDDFSLSPVTGP
jgi:hypothetical protein